MRISRNFRSVSFQVCFFLSIAIIFFRFFYPPVNTLSWDVFGYYLYLPAGFIYHDISLHDLGWVNAIVEKYHSTGTLYQLYQVPPDSWVIKESIGMAVLNAPAFFTAHQYSILSGYPADGFSLPYQYSFAISGLIYACIGVFMLRKILLEYFDETTSSVVLVLIVAGTNYFQLTAFEGMLSHNYVFTIYTFIIWFTIRWHKEPKRSYAAWLGLSMGLAILCRPSEMVCILIPLLWGIYNRDSLVQKWKMIIRKWDHLVILAAMMFLAGLPQLIYWKVITGHWIYYTYNNPGEGFDFLKPYILPVLFSFRKGWLIYTPLMAFAIAGLYFLYRKQRPVFVATVVYLILNLWIVGSWTAWTYGGGSFSQRGLLSSYVILALPLGYLVDAMRRWKMPSRSAAYSILFLLVLLNIFQTWQWVSGIIDRTRMSRAYYFAVFGKTTVSPADRELLMIDRFADDIIPVNKKGLVYKQLFLNEYESPGNYEKPDLSDTAFSGNHSLLVVPSKPFAAGYEIAYNDLTKKEYAWLRISIMVYPLTPVKDNPASLVASFEHKGGAYKYVAESITKEKYAVKPFQWSKVSFDYLTPEVRSTDDILKVYFWLQGQSLMLIDDFRVEMWEPVE